MELWESAREYRLKVYSQFWGLLRAQLFVGERQTIAHFAAGSCRMEDTAETDGHNDRRHNRLPNYAEGAHSQPRLFSGSPCLLLHLCGSARLAYCLQIHRLPHSGDYDESDSLPVSPRSHVSVSFFFLPFPSLLHVVSMNMGILCLMALPDNTLFIPDYGCIF